MERAIRECNDCTVRKKTDIVIKGHLDINTVTHISV